MSFFHSHTVPPCKRGDSGVIGAAFSIEFTGDTIVFCIHCLSHKHYPKVVKPLCNRFLTILMKCISSLVYHDKLLPVKCGQHLFSWSKLLPPLWSHQSTKIPVVIYYDPRKTSYSGPMWHFFQLLFPTHGGHIHGNRSFTVQESFDSILITGLCLLYGINLVIGECEWEGEGVARRDHSHIPGNSQRGSHLVTLSRLILTMNRGKCD